MDIKQESLSSATEPGGDALSAPSRWPECFYPGEHYYVADLTAEHGWQAYCEVLAITPSGYSATEWTAGEGAPVTIYNQEFPSGTYDELYDPDDDLLLIRLTPEQFAHARHGHWPDLTAEVWRTVDALDESLYDELWDEFCRESFCRITVRAAVQRRLSGDQPSIETQRHLVRK